LFAGIALLTAVAMLIFHFWVQRQHQHCEVPAATGPILCE
jgi:hypothetical protein